MHPKFWQRGYALYFLDDEGNPLLARLPVGIRGPIKHMTMQDHYMQVTTTRGKELILMRMGDAVGMLQQGEGMQVHRSH